MFDVLYGAFAKQTRSDVQTLAFSFIGGVLMGAFAGWLLVPTYLPVEYLTPVALSGCPAGVMFGGVVIWYRRSHPRTS